MTAGLKDRLEVLYARVDAAARLRADPVAYPRRYADPRDAEIAGLVAALLAYGRVDLFRPVLARLFAITDLAGGPGAYVQAFDPELEAPALRPIAYRWNRGGDFVLLFATLRRVLEILPGLEALFHAWRPSHLDVREALVCAITTLRQAAVDVAASCGVRASSFEDLPRGFRYFLPSPSDGSACKRWNMYLRWMVRPPVEGIDLGLWSSIPPSALIVPLDTHVARIARFVGLTRRVDGSWRTAAEVTAGLRRLDPLDPVRYDFSIAHLGISGACLGFRHPDVCPTCPLDAVCHA
jgi:uncharacterized protein (TIGR02757 family)